MRKDGTNLTGIRLVATGFFIIAIASLGLQVVRIFKIWNLAEFGVIAAHLLAWVLILFGIRSLLRYNRIWKRAQFVAIVVITFIVLEGLLALKNVKGGLQEQAFIDVLVMFVVYLAILGLLYEYRTVLRNTGVIIKGADSELARRCLKTYKPACITIMATLILVPMAGIFPRTVEYVAVGIFGLIGFVVQSYMCKLLLDSEMVIGEQ